jgi:hypothetical protein
VTANRESRCDLITSPIVNTNSDNRPLGAAYLLCPMHPHLLHLLVRPQALDGSLLRLRYSQRRAIQSDICSGPHPAMSSTYPTAHLTHLATMPPSQPAQGRERQRSNRRTTLRDNAQRDNASGCSGACKTTIKAQQHVDVLTSKD